MQLTDPKAYEYYLTDAVAFVEDMIIGERTDEHGQIIKLNEKQVEFLQAIAQGKWPVVKSGRGTGKTAALAWVILWWLYVHETAKIICTSIKVEQLSVNLWPELRRWIHGSPIEPDIEWTKTKCFIAGREQENFAVAQTGATAEALQGAHDPFLLLIIEEASGVESANFDALLGSLTQAYNSMILVGNPTRSSGPFIETFRRPTGRFYPIHIPCYDPETKWLHPNVQMDFVENMAARYGVDSNPYRVYVLGLEPKTEDDVIIPWEWVNEAVNREVTPDSRDMRIWGVDVAVSGTGDRTALVERHGPVVHPNKILQWRGLDTRQTAGRIHHMWRSLDKKFRPDMIYVDIIGVGHGVMDALKEFGLPVTGIAVSTRPAVKGRFAYLRDELWWTGREWFESRAVSIPDSSDLISELTTPKYSIPANGKVYAESKKDYKKRLEGNSPDIADALLLTFAGGIERLDEHADYADAYYASGDDEDYGVDAWGAW